MHRSLSRLGFGISSIDCPWRAPLFLSSASSFLLLTLASFAALFFFEACSQAACNNAKDVGTDFPSGGACSPTFSAIGGLSPIGMGVGGVFWNLSALARNANVVSADARKGDAANPPSSIVRARRKDARGAAWISLRGAKSARPLTAISGPVEARRPYVNSISRSA